MRGGLDEPQDLPTRIQAQAASAPAIFSGEYGVALTPSVPRLLRTPLSVVTFLLTNDRTCFTGPTNARCPDAVRLLVSCPVQRGTHPQSPAQSHAPRNSFGLGTRSARSGVCPARCLS